MPRLESWVCMLACLLSVGRCDKDQEQGLQRGGFQRNKNKLMQMAVDSQANVAVLEKSHVVVAEQRRMHAEVAKALAKEQQPDEDGDNPPEDPKPEDYKCNNKNTSRYDTFVQDMLPAQSTGKELAVDASTVVFVLAMQNDFLFGSLGLPCERDRTSLNEHVSKLIKVASDKGAVVVASMDFHPKSHCSFEAANESAADTGSCKNEFYFTEADKKDKTRYQNDFPHHTTFDVKDGKVELTETPKDDNRGWTKGFRGAALVDPIREALSAASTAHKDGVFEMFQGFKESIDSFAAFPHLMKKDGDQITYEPFTGGFMPGSDHTKALEGSDTACFEKPEQQTSCFPTVDDMKDQSKLTRVDFLLNHWRKERKPKVNKVIVVGLFFDFSVKETAMAVKKYFKSVEDDAAEVVVVADWTRPAHTGSAIEPNPAKFGQAAIDMYQAGVKFARAKEDKLILVELKYKPEDVIKNSAYRSSALLMTATLAGLSVYHHL